MGLLSWLFGSPSAEDTEKPSASRSIILNGNGNFDFEVVGESNYQGHLEAVAGGRSEEGSQIDCVAVLLPEKDNPYDSNAVAVVINGKIIGYLPRESAARYRHSISQINPMNLNVGCRAMIVGGWDRGSRDRGHFGVKLDVAWPLRQMTE